MAQRRDRGGCYRQDHVRQGRSPLPDRGTEEPQPQPRPEAPASRAPPKRVPGIVDHAGHHRRQLEAEPAKCRGPLQQQESGHGEGVADTAQQNRVREAASGQDRPFQRHDVGGCFRHGQEQHRRDDDLQNQKRPTADWGGMVRENATLITFGDITPLLPAGAIALLTVAVNFVVDWHLHRASGLKE